MELTRDAYWSIWRVANGGDVEWFEKGEGYAASWSRSWLMRYRFGSRAQAMATLWDLRHRHGGVMTLVRVIARQPTRGAG